MVLMMIPALPFWEMYNEEPEDGELSFAESMRRLREIAEESEPENTDEELEYAMTVLSRIAEEQYFEV